MDKFEDPDNIGGRYVLDEHGEARPEPDLFVWARWFERRDRILQQTRVGPCLVSTVFLGLDHRFGFGGPPVLWETMIFGGAFKGYEYQDRYTTRAAAELGHQIAALIAMRFGVVPRRLKKACRRVHRWHPGSRRRRARQLRAFAAGQRIKQPPAATKGQRAMVAAFQARMDAHRAHLEATCSLGSTLQQ